MLWGNMILQDEVHNKNMEHGISKSAETVNSLNNIVFLGSNIVNLMERDLGYILDRENNKYSESICQDFVNETYELINQNETYFKRLYVVSDSKLISSDETLSKDNNLVNWSWYEKALKREDIVITKPYMDLLTNEDVITISKKVSNSNYVIGLDIYQRQINLILEKEIEQDGSVPYGFVLNRDGELMATTKYNNEAISNTDIITYIHQYLGSYLEEILNSESAQINIKQGKYSYALISQKTENDWRVIYVVNMKVLNLDSQHYRNLILITFIVCLLMLNVVIIMYYLKRLKANLLKERAEATESDLIKYKNHLEELVMKKTEDIQKKSELLQELNTTIIDNLADIVEFRDSESGQHIKRIRKYVHCLAYKVAEVYPEYNISKEQIDVLYQVSALHDVGKIGISDTILLKPGKLSKEEYEIMKKHTVIGDEIVSRILEKFDPNYAKLGQEVCRHHHERYDGRGYPDGLKGEEIPICAHIVGIADVYDALVEKRTYKKPIEHERALEMIKNGECGVFSDKLIQCLELVADDFLSISKKYG